MIKIMGLVLGLALSSNAVADNLEVMTKNVRAVCQLPAQQAKYWQVTKMANGNNRLLLLEINAEAMFTHAEWVAVQQVLKIQQRRKNKDFGDCTQKLTPVFLNKFADAITVPKTDSVVTPPPPLMTGADRDAHGCIGSAGYAWCERTKDCERPWELAEKEGFELTAQAFSAFCQQVK
jgi:hypothetical protein